MSGAAGEPIIPNAGTAGADAAGSGDAGTAEGAAGSDGGGEKEVKITSHEYVTLKTARENEKALVEENARLKAENAARGTPPTPVSDETADARRELTERRNYIAMLEREAAEKDEHGRPANPAANALLAVHKESLAAEQRVVYRLEMSDVPREQREEVKTFMADHGLRSPALALQFMRGGQYDGVALENARLKEENTRLKANRPPAEGTRIVGEPPAAPPKKEGEVEEVSRDDYIKLMADPKTMTATIAKRRANKLRIL
jgi:hypothetical protein